MVSPSVGGDLRVFRAPSVWAWSCAWVVALGLAWKRLTAAIASPSAPDLSDAFLPAARAILSGQSPYEAGGYVYSPFVALLLTPIANGPSEITVWRAALVIVTLFVCLIGACAVTAKAGPPRAVVFVLAAVTLLSSWSLSVELWLGQTDVLVLLAVMCALLAHGHGRHRLAGVALGMAAVIKSWPALLLLWLARRPIEWRPQELTGVAAAAGAAVAMALLTGGLTAVVDMISAPLNASSQALVAYSVWGAGAVLFTDSGVAEPLLLSQTAARALSASLAVYVVALLLVTLNRPGTASISLLNVAFSVVLLLPVSHYVYLLLPLPALWWWAARALETPRHWQAWFVTVVLLVWWYVAMRRAPAGDGYLVTDSRSYLLVLGSTFAAATVSVVSAAIWRRDDARSAAATRPDTQ